MEGQELLFEEFTSAADFEGRVRRSIFAHVRGLIGLETAASNAGSQLASLGDAGQTGTAVADAPQRENPLSRAGMKFLREFVAKADDPENAETPTVVEVARFRLLGTLLTSDADDPLLAVHDANRLFAARAELDLSLRERRGLIDAGLAEYEHENVPLWHWLELDKGELPWRSVVGRSEAVKIGALSAMRDLGQMIPEDSGLDRRTYVEIWLGEQVPVQRRAAALGYLSEFGLPEDLPLIRKELERREYLTSPVATAAIIKIALRESRTKAFAALLELQPDTVDDFLLGSVFSNASGIDDQGLEAGVSHRNSGVRLACVRTLISRGTLTDVLAEQLLDDSSLYVRLEVMKQLVLRGRVFSGPEVDRLLVVRERGRGLGLFGLGNLKVNDDRLTEFRDWQRRSAPDAELDAEGSVFDREGEFILDERHFARRGDALRAAVRNQYKDRFEAALGQMVERSGSDQVIVEGTQTLQEFVRQQHTRSGLDIICRRGDARDLTLVRHVMDSAFVGYSEDEIGFLRRHGEWEDISRIAAATERSAPSKPGASTVLGLMIAPGDDAKYVVAAKAMSFLGRKRPNEIFGLKMTDRLRRQLIIEMTDAGFASLSDGTIMELFRSKDAKVRKAASLKSVRAVPRIRQQRLLSRYLQEEYRFYNVILWLDLGASLQRESARGTAQRLLSRISK